MKSKLQQTSQGNNTKTDAVSTTTTILPVYGVTLAGVGDLMTAATKHLMREITRKRSLSQTSVSLAGVKVSVIPSKSQILVTQMT
jgi:hypothetical protein